MTTLKELLANTEGQLQEEATVHLDTSNHPYVDFGINIDKNVAKKLNSKLNSRDYIISILKGLVSPNAEIEINDFFDTKLNILTTLENQEEALSSQDNFQRWLQTIVSTLNTALKVDKLKIPFPKTIVINSRGIPKTKVAVKTLSIICPSNFTLSGIQKNVDVNTLQLRYSHNIIGNVLGLLKIPSLKEIKLSGAIANDRYEKETKVWHNIIQNHLEDKDILAAQEELIDAGLKQYAKL